MKGNIIINKLVSIMVSIMIIVSFSLTAFAISDTRVRINNTCNTFDYVLSEYGLSNDCCSSVIKDVGMLNSVGLASEYL